MANDNTLNVEITSSVDGLKKGLVQADKGLKKFDAQATKTTKKTAKMGKAVSVNATPALQEFSRVVQDAPFGIMGVGNNIQQLTANFGHLSKKTGGAKGALKAMVGALAGSGGVLLAVSAVTTILTVYGKDIANFVKGTSEAAKQAKNLATEIDNIDLALKSLDLKKKLSEIFGKETIKVDTKVLQNLRDKRKNQQKLLDLKLLEVRAAEREAKVSSIVSVSRVTESEQKEINKLSLEYNALFDEVKKSDLAIQKLEETLSTGTGAEISGKNIETLTGKIATTLQTAQATIAPIAQSFNDTIAGSIPSSEVITAKATDMLVALHNFNQAASNIISNSIANTFADLGFVIGEALATGGNVLEAAGAALLGSLGNILIQMGEMAITIGVGMLGIKTALKTLNPAVAIAAGVALIGLGGFFSAKSKSISEGIGGGSSGASDSGGSSSFSGGSTSGFSGGSGAGGTYVFEIAGTKLVGVLKNTLDRNRALGGSLGFTS